jgi:catechol 2,3-dioxygenase-like lactoylglutathione lyase family enzyme
MPARKKTSPAGGKRTQPNKARPKARVRSNAAARSKRSPRAAGADIPQFFRLNIEVGNLDQAERFYGTLLGLTGRRQAGSRVYFQAGPVTLQVVDVSARGGAPHPAAKALYFTVRDLESAFARAQGLGCLSRESVHDAPGGGIVVRPWGERSFYAEDPWTNPLCFVEQGTIYAG